MNIINISKWKLGLFFLFLPPGCHPPSPPCFLTPATFFNRLYFGGDRLNWDFRSHCL